VHLRLAQQLNGALDLRTRRSRFGLAPAEARHVHLGRPEKFLIQVGVAGNVSRHFFRRAVAGRRVKHVPPCCTSASRTSRTAALSPCPASRENDAELPKPTTGSASFLPGISRMMTFCSP